MTPLVARLRGWLRGRSFYDLMQVYRHAPITGQADTSDAFESVLDAVASTVEELERAGADGESPPAPGDDEPELPTFQLNGDARLQFWRDVYLAALPPLLATLPPGNAGSFAVLEMTRLACDAADAALAQHLARNNGAELDLLVGSLLVGSKATVSK